MRRLFLIVSEFEPHDSYKICWVMHGVYLCKDLRANLQVYKLHIYWKGGMAKNWYFYIFLTKFCLFLYTISCILSYLQILIVIGHNIPMSWVKKLVHCEEYIPVGQFEYRGGNFSAVLGNIRDPCHEKNMYFIWILCKVSDKYGQSNRKANKDQCFGSCWKKRFCLFAKHNNNSYEFLLSTSLHRQVILWKSYS